MVDESLELSPAAEAAPDRHLPGSPTVHIVEGHGIESGPSHFDAAIPGPIGLVGGKGVVALPPELLARHTLFIGGIGTGKTNAMMGLVRGLRAAAGDDDVFVFFDTKGDYLQAFGPETPWGREGDVILSNDRNGGAHQKIWNLFADLFEEDPEWRVDEVFEIAGTIFEEQAASAGDNLFFTFAARDLFAGVVEAVIREPGLHDNAVLRGRLEDSQLDLYNLLKGHQDLRGARHYISGDNNTARSVLAFLQQTVRSTFSGVFRLPGDFSIRQFVRTKHARAVFVEYDIAAGTLLRPIYRILIDLALKEALSRAAPAGNVYVILDEFSLLPRLRHIADALNFGRGLGLKFVVGTQNVGQVYEAYDEATGNSLLSSFGTVVSFRATDRWTRTFVEDRYGSNRKLIVSQHSARTQGLQREFLEGRVIEDWDLAALAVGEAVVALPEQWPFRFKFAKYEGEHAAAAAER